MSAQEQVVQFVREWLKAGATPGTPLTDVQVKKQDVKGPRPALPYLAVKVLVADIEVGEDEDRYTDGGAGLVNQHTVGHRRGTVSIQGYGKETAEWLARAHRMLRDPLIMRTVLKDEATGEGISLVALGSGLVDLSAFLDTEIEPRYLREYDVAYAVSDIADPQSGPEATSIEVTSTFYKNDPAEPDAIVRTTTVP